MGAKQSKMLTDSQKRMSHVVDAIELLEIKCSKNISSFDTKADQSKEKVRLKKGEAVAKLNYLEDKLLRQVDEK